LASIVPGNRKFFFTFFIFRTLDPQQHCVFLINQLDLKANNQFFNITARIVNDGIHDTVIFGVGEYFFDCEKLTVKLLVKLPENDRDENYQRVFFRTKIDMSRFFNGIGGTNLATKALMDSMIKSIDFEPKLPLKKVKKKRAFSLI
jgi:hypothetical protein